MNEYIKKISNKPDFEQENYFKGYYLSRGKLGIEVDYIDMVSGHQFFQKETKSIHIYYIIEGRGIAYIDGNRFEIEQGDTIEIPVGTEFALKGKMKMIEIMNPPFEPSTHIDTRKIGDEFDEKFR